MITPASRTVSATRRAARRAHRPIHPGQPAGVTGDRIVLAHEQDAATTASLGPQPIAGPQPRGIHRVLRDRDLVLGANGRPSSPSLYFVSHE